MSGYYDDSGYSNYNATGAAISVGVAVALAIIVMYVFNKSGFRAMVAVGRG